jgi:hypothetical protein
LWTGYAPTDDLKKHGRAIQKRSAQKIGEGAVPMPSFIRNTLLLLSIVLAACASVGTVQRADQFATAGIEYTNGVPAVIDQSFEIAVTTNSIVLERTRMGLKTMDDRLKSLEEFDEQFKQRLILLRDIKTHTETLRAYFIALRSLAQSDAATGITDATNGLVNKLGELNPKIASAQIGGAPISGLIAPVVNIAVGAYQNAAIKNELDAHGKTIERELALQEAVLTALTNQMIADKDSELQETERNPIIRQFAGDGALPADWSERRISSYRRTIEIDSLKTAQKAATNFHQAWVALSENRLDESSLMLLLQDIGELADLARTFRTN